MDFELKIVNEQSTDRYLLKNNNGEIYNISPIVYTILTKRRAGLDYSVIAADINVLFDTTVFNEQNVAEAEATIISKISNSNNSKKQQTSYIRLKRTLIPAGGFAAGYRALAFLFRKTVFILLCLSSFLATLYFFISNSVANILPAYRQTIDHFSPLKLLLFYTCFLVIVLIHELGHASATYRFGLKPKEIGAGFYFIFPVFYTNVTDIWELPLKRRILVNTGGIYFQLLINLTLIILYSLTLLPPFCSLLIVANTISLLSALNPFFRYDGYWIVSDMLHLPNLRGKTRKILLQLVTGKAAAVKAGRPLLIYTAGYILFWSLLYFSLAKYSIGRLKIIYGLATGQSFGTLLSSIDFLTSAVLLIFLIFVITNLIFRTIKAVIYEYKHVPQQA